jgi:hypothetical protein
MTVKVPPVTMGKMCECGRGRIPSNLVVCYACLEDRRLAFWEIYNREHAEWHELGEAALLPVDPAAVKCGLRRDVPKRERVHQYAELGQDVRHSGDDGRPRMTRVRVCVRCGVDKQGG